MVSPAECNQYFRVLRIEFLRGKKVPNCLAWALQFQQIETDKQVGHE